MVLRIAIIALLLLSSCGEDVSVEEELDSHISGKTMFTQRCANCHGMDGTMCLSGAADLSKSTLSTVEIQKIIEEGKGVMPPFKLIIDSPKTMEETIEHIKSLRVE